AGSHGGELRALHRLRLLRDAADERVPARSSDLLTARRAPSPAQKRRSSSRLISDGSSVVGARQISSAPASLAPATAPRRPWASTVRTSGIRPAALGPRKLRYRPRYSSICSRPFGPSANHEPVTSVGFSVRPAAFQAFRAPSNA